MSLSGSWASYDLADPPTEIRRRLQRGTYTDFVLFALLPMSYFQAGGLPVSEMAMGLAVVLAATRRSRVKAPLWLITLLPALFALFVLSAQLNDLQPVRRLLHLGLYVALALLAAQGRFHNRSMGFGLGIGLIVSASAYFVGYGTGYAGRLAGLMEDPNVAGYLLTVLGCLALAGMGPSRLRLPAGLLIMLFVVLTFSRTSLLAAALVVVWVVIGRRVSTPLGLLLLSGMFYVVTHVPTSLQSFGPFSDRTGSDELRVRIVALEQLRIDSAPWYGHGPGTSKVDVQGLTFFFHNSYLALLNEGGRYAQVVLLLAGACALVSLIRRPPTQRSPWTEGALVAAAVCAVNLGEVLLELPVALAIGMAAMRAKEPFLDLPAPTTRPDPAASRGVPG